MRKPREPSPLPMILIAFIALCILLSGINLFTKAIIHYECSRRAASLECSDLGGQKQ